MQSEPQMFDFITNPEANILGNCPKSNIRNTATAILDRIMPLNFLCVNHKAMKASLNSSSHHEAIAEEVDVAKEKKSKIPTNLKKLYLLRKLHIFPG